MSECPICRSGELKDERVETWMRKVDQWVLLTRVPAMRCDTCGETTFAREVAERLADILTPDSTDRPTGSRSTPEYDFEKLNRVRSNGAAPKLGVGTTR